MRRSLIHCSAARNAGAVLALAFTFPLFLLVRERTLAQRAGRA